MIGALKRITSFLVHKSQLVFLICLGTAVNVVFVLYVGAVRDLINTVIELRGAAALRWTVIAGVLSVIIILVRASYVILQHKLYLNCATAMRTRFFQKLHAVSLRQLEGLTTADIVTRFNQDLDCIAEFLSGGLVRGITNLVFLAVFAVYTARCDWRLLVVVLPLLPALVVFVLRQGQLLERENRAYLTSLSRAANTAKDVFDHALDISAFQAEQFFLTKWGRHHDPLVASEVQKTYSSTALWASGIVLYNVIYLFFYSIGGLLAFKGLISFGAVVGLFLVIDRLVSTLKSLPEFVVSAREAAVRAERVNAVLALPEEGRLSYRRNYTAQPIVLTQLDSPYVVVLDRVTYRYADNPVLRQLSLQVRQGEKVALVGKSGCGKSTLLKLLAGCDYCYQGSAVVLGRELKEWEPGVLRQQVTYLPQEPFLFSQSVHDNLYLYTGCRDTSLLQHYLQLMELDERLLFSVLKRGGRNISGGQRQRLGLILGLLKPAQILLIDEGFSAVDPDMAARILAVMLREHNGTVIAVTHRLTSSMMKQFDRILLLDDGSVLVSGSHQELLNHKHYRSLYFSSLQAGEVRGSLV